MAKISKHHNNPANQQAYQYLLKLLTNCHDEKVLAQLFNAILTDKEQLEVANRLRIFAMFQQERPQREISEKLGVGIATVSRGAKAFHQHDIDQLLPNLANELLTDIKTGELSQ